MIYSHKVKYYECDRMGVTHHSNYIRFMEEARVDWLDQLGLGFERMEADGIVSPVMALDSKYLRTTTFQDEILVEVRVKSFSTLKLVFEYEMTVGGQVVYTGTSTHCFLSGGRPISLATRYPDFCAKFVPGFSNKD